MFALLDGSEVTILVDTVSRGGAPGTLYTIEPEVDGTLWGATAGIFESAHRLEPVRTLAIAKGLGSPLGRVFLVGCEPATLESDNGHIGLSDAVDSAVGSAVEMIRSLVKSMNGDWGEFESRERTGCEMKVLKIMRYVTAATIVIGVMWNLGDIQRYIKIEMM